MSKNSNNTFDVFFVLSNTATLFYHSFLKKGWTFTWIKDVYAQLRFKRKPLRWAGYQTQQMRNTNSSLTYRETRAKTPALSSTRGAAAAAWKTSTPSILYHQENTWLKSQRAFEESHETNSRPNSGRSRHSFPTVPAHSRGAEDGLPGHSLTEHTPLTLTSQWGQTPLHKTRASLITRGNQHLAEQAQLLPVQSYQRTQLDFLSVIMNGKTRMQV